MEHKNKERKQESQALCSMTVETRMTMLKKEDVTNRSWYLQRRKWHVNTVKTSSTVGGTEDHKP
jgi:hypothetical protein